MHPELANSVDKTVYLCSKCNDCVTSKEAKYSNSIKNGNDFGNTLRLGLTKITPIERSAIAVARSHHIMHKLKALNGQLRNSTKGHAIAFLHETPKKQQIFHTQIRKQSNRRNYERD